MADNIIPGSEVFSFGFMKPGVDEEVNALWGRKMAANDGVYAGSLVDTTLGHVRFMQGTLCMAKGGSGTAYLTEDGADGGVRVFSFLPIVQVTSWHLGQYWLQQYGDHGTTFSAILEPTGGTMLVVRREAADASDYGTYIWTAIGL